MNILSDISESTNGERAWFALYTRSRCEFKAAEQINSLGIKLYLPTVTRIRQWSDRKKKITEPVLRGYILIYATEKERSASLEFYYVTRCIFDHGKPAKIPAWQIENLAKMLKEDRDFFVYEGIVPGVHVKIKEGPFAGVIGTVQETENGKTFAVSIHLLNRSVIAHLPRDSSFEILKNFDHSNMVRAW